MVNIIAKRYTPTDITGRTGDAVNIDSTAVINAAAYI
jgi:hypothetical protein